MNRRLLYGRHRKRRLRVCEAKPEDGAAARRLLGDDGAAVRLRHFADDGEPEAGPGKRAGGGGPVEAVEDVLAILLGDPGAVVADPQLAVDERDLDVRAGRAPLAGVLEQVPDRAFEAVARPVQRRRLELRVEGEVRKAAVGPL